MLTSRPAATMALSALAALLLATGCGSAAGSRNQAGAGSTTATPASTSASPASTSASPSSSAPTSPTSTPASSAARSSTAAPRLSAAQLAAKLTGLFGTGGSYSVAALDLTTGRSSQAGAHGGMVLASLVKLDILETLLYQRQRSGQPLTAGQEDDVEAMIEHSDNAAADRLFRLIGQHQGMARYNAVLDLHDTVLDTEGLWGLSTTSANDQLQLLQALVSPGSPLTAASRKHALDLLGDVEADQRWGVGAAGDRGSAALNKNGWLGVDDDQGRWAVNSGGVVRIGGHQVLMVVLSQHQPDFSTGVSRVERAAGLLAATL